ncbi:MAG: MFS transporter [Alphaproteobacteria bacterium]|nr:MFS transporter [Alphaproteobacteria bacterium]
MIIACVKIQLTLEILVLSPYLMYIAKYDESLFMTVSTTAPQTPDETVRTEQETTSHNIIEILPIPQTVWVLGCSMFLLNLSFMMTFSFSGLYLQMLGVGLVGIGFLEGLSEAASFVMKFTSGLISDALRRRKPIMVIGYFFTLVARPLMAIATGFNLYFSGKILERLGNGIQGAPRDAIVADITPASRIGSAYGLKRSLATAGSFMGAICGYLVMCAFNDDIRTVFLFACIPTTIAFFLLIFFIKEPKRYEHSAVSSEVPLPAEKRRHRVKWSNLRLLGSSFWLLMLINSIFMLSRVGEQFIILHAKTNFGLLDRYAPIIFMIFNAGWCATSYPIGVIADRMNRYWLLAIGIILLVLADIILATAGNLSILSVGVLFWGFQYGITMNIFSSLIAEIIPENLRGTGFGCFYIINATAILIAEPLVGGWVSKNFGFHNSFIVSAVIGLVALIALILIMGMRSSHRRATI